MRGAALAVPPGPGPCKGGSAWLRGGGGRLYRPRDPKQMKKRGLQIVVGDFVLPWSPLGPPWFPIGRPLAAVGPRGLPLGPRGLPLGPRIRGCQKPFPATVSVLVLVSEPKFVCQNRNSYFLILPIFYYFSGGIQAFISLKINLSLQKKLKVSNVLKKILF